MRPPSDAGRSSFPRSPTIDSSTASSIFPYSTARPLTGYSDLNISVAPSTYRRSTKQKNLFDDIEEIEEPEGDETPVYARSDYSTEAGQMTMGPNTAPTAWSRSSYGGKAAGSFIRRRSTNSAFHRTSADAPSRSSLRSIVDLQSLAVNPRAAPSPQRQSTTIEIWLPPVSPGRPAPLALKTETTSMPIITPIAQTRLGRMSMAPARYALSPKPVAGNGLGSASRKLTSPRIGHRTFRARYLAWNIYLNAFLGLISALLLTFALHTTGSVGELMNATSQSDSWTIRVSGSTTDSSGTGSVPGTNASILLICSDLILALACFAWLHALHSMVKAFLQFYLFFALSVPVHHLVDASIGSNEQGQKDETADSSHRHAAGSEIQAEVDLRPRCENTPFEGYLWVWWAWWAHRRGPLGWVFAVLTSVLGVISVRRFWREVPSANAHISLGW